MSFPSVPEVAQLLNALGDGLPGRHALGIARK